MSILRLWPMLRRPPSVAGPDPDDVLYQAAHEMLLAAAVRPPGMLGRLRRLIWHALQTLHARRRTDGDTLPPNTGTCTASHRGCDLRDGRAAPSRCCTAIRRQARLPCTLTL
jgi:hypothetical protein